jgi:hypothetical protein
LNDRTYHPGETVLVRATMLELTSARIAGTKGVAMIRIADGPNSAFTITTFAPLSEIAAPEQLGVAANGGTLSGH